MSSTKQPTNETAIIGSTAKSATDPGTETGDTSAEAPLTLLERVKLLKSRQQLSHPDPRGVLKGPRIGNGPRGTRRSMGKR